MFTTRTVLLIFHIAAAALLFGTGTGIVRTLKKSAQVGGRTLLIAAEDAARRSSIMSGASLFTIATGVALIFNMGGFAVAPKNFHTALLVMLGAIAVSLSLLKPAAARIEAQAKSDNIDQAVVSVAIKKMAMGQGILHLLWIILLVLMFVRF